MHTYLSLLTPEQRERKLGAKAMLCQEHCWNGTDCPRDAQYLVDITGVQITYRCAEHAYQMFTSLSTESRFRHVFFLTPLAETAGRPDVVSAFKNAMKQTVQG